MNHECDFSNGFCCRLCGIKKPEPQWCSLQELKNELLWDALKHETDKVGAFKKMIQESKEMK